MYTLTYKQNFKLRPLQVHYTQKKLRKKTKYARTIISTNESKPLIWYGNLRKREEAREIKRIEKLMHETKEARGLNSCINTYIQKQKTDTRSFSK